MSKLSLGCADIGEGLGTITTAFAVLFGFFANSSFLFGLEFLYAAELVDKAHLTGKERVAFGADINGHGRSGRASLERGTTGAGDSDLVVGRMNVCFHKRRFYHKISDLCQSLQGRRRRR